MVKENARTKKDIRSWSLCVRITAIKVMFCIKLSIKTLNINNNTNNFICVVYCLLNDIKNAQWNERKENEIKIHSTLYLKCT